MKLRNKVVKILRKHKEGSPFHLILKNMQKLGVGEGELREVIGHLKETGRIFESKKDFFQLVQGVNSQIKVATNLFEGPLIASRKGFGFVRTSIGDIFVPARKIKNALHGDIVLVRKLTGKKPAGGSENAEGEIVKIIERVRTQIVGCFIRNAKMR